MPENLIFAQVAYGATVVLYTAYALSLVWRRRGLRSRQESQARHRAASGGTPR